MNLEGDNSTDIQAEVVFKLFQDERLLMRISLYYTERQGSGYHLTVFNRYGGGNNTLFLDVFCTMSTFTQNGTDHAHLVGVKDAAEHAGQIFEGRTAQRPRNRVRRRVVAARIPIHAFHAIGAIRGIAIGRRNRLVIVSREVAVP